MHLVSLGMSAVWHLVAFANLPYGDPGDWHFVALAKAPWATVVHLLNLVPRRPRIRIAAVEIRAEEKNTFCVCNLLAGQCFELEMAFVMFMGFQ